MTEAIRQSVKTRIEAQHKTKADVAREVGLAPQYLHRMLNVGVGDVPGNWAKVLDHLGLELTVKHKGK